MDNLLATLLEPHFFTFTIGILGLIVGSFLNVVIYRLPKMMEHSWQMQYSELRQEAPPVSEPFNLLMPRSRCPHCKQTISMIENVPVLSFLALRGQCRACRKPISLRYPIVEGLTGLLSAYMAWHFGATLAGLGALIFVWCMIALTFIDMDTQFLPDSITLPLIWMGLLFNLHHTYISLDSALIGAVAGYLSLWLVYWSFKLVTGKEGMGYGDFKLLSAIGAWLGWQLLPLTVFISSLVGAAVGILLILLGKNKRATPIPFGPYLAGAGLIMLIWGEKLFQMI